MKLIGRYDSPYVKRVGVSVHLLVIPFELQALSPFSQANELVLDNGPFFETPRRGSSGMRSGSG
jgi:glutathione S-transferase